MSDENITDENESTEVQAEETPQPKRRGRPPKVKPEESAPSTEPAVGRIVHYVTRSGLPRPAIIVGLIEEGQVQVVVFNSSGGTFVNNVSFGDDLGNVYFPTY